MLCIAFTQIPSAEGMIVDVTHGGNGSLLTLNPFMPSVLTLNPFLPQLYGPVHLQQKGCLVRFYCVHVL